MDKTDMIGVIAKGCGCEKCDAKTNKVEPKKAKRKGGINIELKDFDDRTAEYKGYVESFKTASEFLYYFDCIRESYQKYNGKLVDIANKYDADLSPVMFSDIAMLLNKISIKVAKYNEKLKRKFW